MKQAGLSVREDPVGNVIGTYNPADSLGLRYSADPTLTPSAAAESSTAVWAC
ncbi:MAG: hypothetical protein ACLSA6_18465 [Holdemania massiliensis]